MRLEKKNFDFFPSSQKNRNLNYTIGSRKRNLRCHEEVLLYGNIHFYALNRLLKIYYFCGNFSFSYTFSRSMCSQVHGEIKLKLFYFDFESHLVLHQNSNPRCRTFVFPFRIYLRNERKIFVTQAGQIFEMASALEYKAILSQHS